VRDAAGFIDIDAHKAGFSATEHFDLDKLQALRLSYALSDLFDPGRNLLPHAYQCGNTNKKVGFRPLASFDIPLTILSLPP
jgi:hypothetical protein